MDTVQLTCVNGQPTATRTRLVRLHDWECHGPYAILAQENNRIVRLEVSISRAVEYLRQAGLREFDIDYSLYRAELWARREGSNAPLYGLSEKRTPHVWNVLLQSEDFR